MLVMASKRSDIGPLINEAGLEKVEEHIKDAVDKGAKIMVGGRRHEKGQTFFQPTLLRDMSDDMKIATEETFGLLRHSSALKTRTML